MIRKKYETDDAFEVILNADLGEIQILHITEVVPSEELPTKWLKSLLRMLKKLIQI